MAPEKRLFVQKHLNFHLAKAIVNRALYAILTAFIISLRDIDVISTH